MGRTGIQLFDDSRNGFFSVSDLGSDWTSNHHNHSIGGLFASVNQSGSGFGSGFASGSLSSSNNSNNSSFSAQVSDLYTKYMPGKEEEEEEVVINGERTKKKKGGLKLKIKIANPSLRRLLSGAVAGAVSRTVVAPLETIRTHLMVGSGGNSSAEVFGDIMKHEGWTGLFRGNLVNVIRVAPARAVEVTTMDQTKRFLSLDWNI